MEDREGQNRIKEGKAISWKAAEYEFRAKTVGWYFAVWGVTLALAVFGFFQGNFFFSLFVLLAGAMVVAFGRRRPRIVQFEIDAEGIKIDKKRYPYAVFSGFSMQSRPQRLDQIVLRKKTSVNPFVRIPIDAKLAGEVKQLLAAHLTEEEYHESLIDILAEWFGV